MKNKFTPVFVVLGILVIYIFILCVSSETYGDKYPPNTVFNTNESGISLVFDTLKELGYPVDIGYRPINGDSDINDIQILIMPNHVSFGEKEINNVLDWVSKGGHLVFYKDNYSNFEKYLDAPISTDGYYSVYKYNLGEIFVCDHLDIINSALKDNAAPGQDLTAILDYFDSTNIIFNEYYHGFQENPSFWSTLPSSFKIIGYQILAICILIIWFLGKGFGKPTPYYEEIEREENEYIKALSVIYRNAGMGSVIINCYYDHFIKSSARYFNLSEKITRESIKDVWEKENMPDKFILESVHTSLAKESKFNIKTFLGCKNFHKTIKHINTLTEYVKFKY